MGMCNEDNAYYQFKRRNVKMDADEFKPKTPHYKINKASGD